MDEDIVKFFGVMMSLVVVGLFGYGGILAIHNLQSRFKRRDHPPSLDPDEVEALRIQLDEVEQLKTRLVELEERVDFTERLLAQSPEPNKLPGSTS